MAKTNTLKVEGIAIKVENLSVFYNESCVLKNVNMKVKFGEFVSLVGESGSGKTTLLNSLAKFVPSNGAIEVHGKIGVVFQDYSVFPWMTVEQNIAFGLRKIDKKEKARIVEKHLKLIGLERHAGKYPAELSGGQTQRVGIARALAPKPEVILMDEPFGALDRQTRDRMQKWLLEVWAEEQLTIIFVTHDIEEALFLSDRVLTMKNNTISGEHEISYVHPRAEEIKFSPRFVEQKKEITGHMFS